MEAAQAGLSLYLSKKHIVGNQMLRLILVTEKKKVLVCSFFHFAPKFGSGREKTCLRGFPSGHTKISLLSYRD